MTVWETTVRTGHPGSDQQALDQIRRQYEPQGLVVQAQAIGGGGLHVRVVRPAPAPPAYGQPSYGQAPHAPYAAPPQPSYGQAPPPYAQPSFAPPPQAAFAAPSGAAQVAPGYYPQGNFAAGPTADAGTMPLGEARVRHLRKVYGLLAISAVLAIGAGSIVTSPLLGVETYKLEGGKSVDIPLVVAVMLENPILEYGCFGALFVGVFLASLVSKVRGVNYAALFAVSALMGLELAPMAFVAQVMAGMGATLSAHPVRDSFAMVGAIFMALTGYVFVTRKDFSYLYATLSMGFVVVLVGCVLAFALGSEPFSLAIASAGALLSIGFLLYQTSRIFLGDMDDPVDDALGLLVQLRNLFLFLLRIFMSRR